MVADNWAILVSTVMMLVGLVVFIYILAIQVTLIAKYQDKYSYVRWMLLAAVASITVAASPVIFNRVYRWLGIYSVALANVSALSVGAFFLLSALAFLILYKYKTKE